MKKAFKLIENIVTLSFMTIMFSFLKQPYTQYLAGEILF